MHGHRDDKEHNVRTYKKAHNEKSWQSGCLGGGRMKIYPNYEARLIPILMEKHMINEDVDVLEDYLVQVSDNDYA
jgi:hypothetical protein